MTAEALLIPVVEYGAAFIGFFCIPLLALSLMRSIGGR